MFTFQAEACHNFEINLKKNSRPVFFFTFFCTFLFTWYLVPIITCCISNYWRRLKAPCSLSKNFSALPVAFTSPIPFFAKYQNFFEFCLHLLLFL